MLDSLPRQWLQLHLIEYNDRFSLEQFHLEDKLQPDKKIIQIRHIAEQVTYLLRNF